MSQCIVSSVPDWSSVKHALDLGCDRGVLLNVVALQLKKSGSSQRIVSFVPDWSSAKHVWVVVGGLGN
ncbi:hypothetical protein ACS0TY_033309 [Phlomoides rotata]